jgi:hypothetical protein
VVLILIIVAKVMKRIFVLFDGKKGVLLDPLRQKLVLEVTMSCVQMNRNKERAQIIGCEEASTSPLLMIRMTFVTRARELV